MLVVPGKGVNILFVNMVMVAVVAVVAVEMFFFFFKMLFIMELTKRVKKKGLKDSIRWG